MNNRYLLLLFINFYSYSSSEQFNNKFNYLCKFIALRSTETSFKEDKPFYLSDNELFLLYMNDQVSTECHVSKISEKLKYADKVNRASMLYSKKGYSYSVLQLKIAAYENNLKKKLEI